MSDNVKYYITVFLNRQEDEDGRLAIFSRMRDEDAYQPGDYLEDVWSGYVTEMPDEDVLELVFEMFNRGAPRFVGDEEYPQRSLSVGDVIEVDETDRYAVERVGFKKITGLLA